jgi:hypothetical protein
MIRAWWDRTMDGRRLLAVAGTMAGFAIFVLGAAALGIRFGLENIGGAIGAVIGSGVRGYLDQRDRGTPAAVAWGLGYATAIMSLFALGAAAVGALAPSVTGLEPVGWHLFVAGLVVFSVASLVWERNPRMRRLEALAFVSLALFFGGMIGLIEGGPWALAGAVSLPVGIVALIVAIVLFHRERQRLDAIRREAVAIAP